MFDRSSRATRYQTRIRKRTIVVGGRRARCRIAVAGPAGMNGKRILDGKDCSITKRQSINKKEERKMKKDDETQETEDDTPTRSMFKRPTLVSVAVGALLIFTAFAYG